MVNHILRPPNLRPREVAGLIGAPADGDLTGTSLSLTILAGDDLVTRSETLVHPLAPRLTTILAVPQGELRKAKSGLLSPRRKS
jgi:hypothetical protein